MEQNLAQKFITKNSLTDSVVCQSPVSFGKRIFSNRELVDMFPEAKKIIMEMIQEDNRIVTQHQEILNQIRDDLYSRVPLFQLDIATALVFSVVRNDFIVHNEHKKTNSGFYQGELVADRLKRNQKLLALYNIKNKSALVDFQIKIEKAKEYPMDNLIKLNKVGYAKCPFHAERTASFYVKRKTNKWKCFGCGEWGDSISFVMKLENMGFKEAVNKLA